MQEKIFGDYRALKEVGQGSLGKVYLAEHRFIKRPYVLKVLPEELSADKAFVTRFEEEVSKLALLDHPHIVKIHNVCLTEGSYFLVTDCIVDAIGEMTNLGQYMAARKERLREEELFSLLHQVAGALCYAHGRSAGEPLIHRSLKLSNILIGKGEGNIRAYVSDFGLAKIIGTASVTARNFKALADALALFPSDMPVKGGEERYSSLPIETTKLSKLTNSFLQNFAFMAPEQKRLSALTAAVDAYAFGVLAYFLITGRYPEGYVEMPSEVVSDYRYDWDLLIRSTLQVNKEKRRVDLLALLEEISQGEKKALRPIVEEKKKEESSLDTVIATLVEAAPPEPAVNERVFITVSAESLSQERVVAAPVVAPPPAQESEPSSRESVVKEYHIEQRERSSLAPIHSESVRIPGGTFMRGSNEGSRDEMPRHQVVVDAFAIDIHPVTNAQFALFLEYMGSEKDQNNCDLIRLKDSRISRSSGKVLIETGYERHPVVAVTWYGALAYAKWVGKRLPTEAEWEIAALGGSVGPYPTGVAMEKKEGNYFSSDTTNVMSYAPNGYGLFDMAGNVYEWCQDWYGYNYYESSALEPKNPRGPSQGVYRVLRGGCWKSLKDDLRCSHRHRNNPGAITSTYGFRCAG